MFLGMKLTRLENQITLSQMNYIDEMIEKFNLCEAKGRSTPGFDIKEILNWREDNKTIGPYRELVGSLQYCANSTRPDISFPVNFLAKFNQDPRERHWTAARTILRYLKQTRDYGITYNGGELTINVFRNSDFANDIEERQSVSGGTQEG